MGEFYIGTKVGKRYWVLQNTNFGTWSVTFIPIANRVLSLVECWALYRPELICALPTPSALWGSWGQMTTCLADTSKVSEGVRLALAVLHQPKPPKSQKLDTTKFLGRSKPAVSPSDSPGQPSPCSALAVLAASVLECHPLNTWPRACHKGRGS